uniref:Uncharacterized protein n=1 Tax=Siphoviridae sp. ctDuC3 TaxID=2827563 RepID=A0A8S5LN50_9CAUD|nr:MAG TPA: hypothetical protein [Siphoviridae sp. ctDuC3]
MITQDELNVLEAKAKVFVKSYYDSLSDKTIFNDALTSLRKKGKSWLYIRTGLEIKSKEQWEKWGYGLFFTPSFQAQIQKNVNKIKAGDKVESLFEDRQFTPEEELFGDMDSTSFPSASSSETSSSASFTAEEDELISDEQLQEMKNSREPFFYNRRGEAYTFNEVQSILSECPTPKDTFNLTWGRFPDSQEAICYYEEELSSILGGF